MSSGTKKHTLALLCLSPLLALSVMFTATSGQSPTGAPRGGGGITGVPEEYVQDVLRAGSICEGIEPALIAAQIQAESGWNPQAVSPVGARGIAQFMPATWAMVGKDGDGDGIAEVTNPHDAIFTEGHYMCGLKDQVQGYVERGLVSGGLIDLTIAAYNAGIGNILRYHGMPPFTETRTYVRRIREAMATFIVAPAGTVDVSAQASADTLLDAPVVDASVFPPEEATIPDNSPGAMPGRYITPRAARLVVDVLATYPQINTRWFQCWQPRPNNALSDHPFGRACDIPFYGCYTHDSGRSADPSTGLRAGNAAANWLAANAGKYGIKYIIWQGKIWQASKGTWGPYTTTDPHNCGNGHFDHIHVSVY